MCGEVYRCHRCIGPFVSCFDVFEDGFFNEGVADCWFVAGVDRCAVNVELCGVQEDAGDFWAVFGVDCLIIDRFMISVAV